MPGPVLGTGLMKVKQKAYTLMEKTVAPKITVLSGKVEVGKGYLTGQGQFGEWGLLE